MGVKFGYVWKVGRPAKMNEITAESALPPNEGLMVPW